VPDLASHSTEVVSCKAALRVAGLYLYQPEFLFNLKSL